MKFGLCCFFWFSLVYRVLRAAGAGNRDVSFSAPTQNGQLVDCEEIFAEFDRKCIGLESITAPLSLPMQDGRLCSTLQFLSNKPCCLTL